jgi:hypothetical protein
MWHLNAGGLCTPPGSERLSQTAVFEWHSCVKASRVSVENDEHSAQSSTNKTIENVEKTLELVMKTVTEQSMCSQTPLVSVMEFARRP